MPLAQQEAHVDPGALRDLARGIAGSLRLQSALHGQQRETVLLHRSTQLLEGHAVRRQLLEQLAPRLASLSARALQQPLGLEVDRHAAILPALEPAIRRARGSTFLECTRGGSRLGAADL